ncbi:armadillo-type protein [Tribonema minus]|uniref:Armadillo-type protein n=1 Tax=Tribonema minus TaxID=303371 RepID=A0A835Z666_9STRA|nr:armadillo-type protein [Tribonema minus]
MDVQIREVKKALDLVYNGSGADHRKADKWLQQFQQTAEAWQVADSLLMMPDAELQVTFFGAMTIHSKIRFDFHELPSATLPSLKSSLTAHLTRWATAKDLRPAVVTRLCLALAALAVQTNWTGAVQELSSAIMQSAPRDQQGRAARVVLELMKVLPEECCNKNVAVADDLREAFRQHLDASAPLLLGFLSEVAAGPLGQDVMVQETIFQCLQSWVRYTSIPPADLAAHPLFPAAFDALRTPDLFEAAADLLVQVLRTYCHPEDSMPIVKIMVPRAMALDAAYAASVAEEDEDTARGLCRLFTEMGESYLEMLLWGEELGQLSLVRMLLACTAHPTPEIAAIPLQFWFPFCEALGELQPQELRAHKLAVFGPTLDELVMVLVRLMRFPEDLDQRTEDQVSDIKQHRYDVADVLRDCCQVLGAVHCLGRAVAALEGELAALRAAPGGAEAWHMAEACLFAARSVAQGVPSHDEDAVPRLLAALPRLPPSSPHLRYTANLVVGRYSRWLKHHPDTLGPMFNYLMGGFQTRDCAAAAATAIKQVCHNCAALMGEPALALYDHLQAAKANIQVSESFHDEIEILEGLCHVASALPLQTALPALHRMAAPIAAGLSAPPSLRGALQDLDRLCVLLEHAAPALGAHDAHPAVALLSGVWAALDALPSRWPESAALAEKLCRCHKHAVRAAGAARAEPLLAPLAARVARAFAAPPHHSPYLYCASVCVGVFGGDARLAPALGGVLVEMSGAVFAMMAGGLPQVRANTLANPDVVEEYYYLLARFVQHCPRPLLEALLLPDAMRLAQLGLQLQHREAHSGVMHFLGEFVDLGTKGRDAEQYRPAVAAVMGAHGEPIIRVLLERIISRDAPAYAADERGVGGKSVVTLLWRLRRLNVQWLRQWLEGAVATAPPAAAPQVCSLLRARIEIHASLPVTWYSAAAVCQSLLVGAMQAVLHTLLPLPDSLHELHTL